MATARISTHGWPLVATDDHRVSTFGWELAGVGLAEPVEFWNAAEVTAFVEASAERRFDDASALVAYVQA